MIIGTKIERTKIEDEFLINNYWHIHGKLLLQNIEKLEATEAPVSYEEIIKRLEESEK